MSTWTKATWAKTSTSAPRSDVGLKDKRHHQPRVLLEESQAYDDLKLVMREIVRGTGRKPRLTPNRSQTDAFGVIEEARRAAQAPLAHAQGTVVSY
jgi:hypothetical protein